MVLTNLNCGWLSHILYPTYTRSTVTMYMTVLLVFCYHFFQVFGTVNSEKKLICANDNVTLMCNESTIYIEGVHYGRFIRLNLCLPPGSQAELCNGSDEAENITKNKCNGKKLCEISKASFKDELGNCNSANQPYLEVAYCCTDNSLCGDALVKTMSTGDSRVQVVLLYILLGVGGFVIVISVMACLLRYKFKREEAVPTVYFADQPIPEGTSSGNDDNQQDESQYEEISIDEDIPVSSAYNKPKFKRSIRINNNYNHTDIDTYHHSAANDRPDKQESNSDYPVISKKNTDDGNSQSREDVMSSIYMNTSLGKK